jgi:UDP-N-acetylglucosamine 4,6-dehydratase
MVGGELFVPKIPSMNIMDLAEAIDPECKTEIVGIRPGEKLHEVMVTRDDARRTLEYDDHYVVQPDFEYWGHRRKENGGKKVAEGFEYNSGTNQWFLTIEEMREMLEGTAI